MRSMERRAAWTGGPDSCREAWKTSRKPDFFMVRAPKAGTSSPCYYLIQHPQIFVPYPKEPQFFYSMKSPGSPVLGTKDLEEYPSLFEGTPESKQAGETSTSYLRLANAASEMRGLQPEAKIIILLRDPVERAYFHYWHTVRYGKRAPSFEEALAEEPDRIRRGLWHGPYYVDCDRYAGQVSRYPQTFGAESVRVYLFEDVSRDARGVCRDVFQFLGVDPKVPVETGKVYNSGGVSRSHLFARIIKSQANKPLKKLLPAASRQPLIQWIKEANNKSTLRISPETRAQLREVFREDILALQEFIGRNLSGRLEQRGVVR